VQKARDAIGDLEEVEDFEEFSLKEKLQALLEGYLEHLLADREFVLESLDMILNSASLAYSDTTPIKKEFKDAIKGFLDEAEEKGEIEDMPFKDIVPEMLCQYVVGVLIYWSKDESEEFADTTQMIDLSLDLGYLILNSGIINKTFDVGSFFLKSYFFRSMGDRGNLLQKLVKAKTAFIAG
ncbi:MAG: TetR/AcrR family transcriptional regulator, partial [Verrucomicrobiota bacterium]